EIVLDHMGEDIRRRLVITTAPDGTEFALRPDFTLPLALWQIEKGSPQGGRYAYSGYAFRFPTSGDKSRVSAEFRQVGIEDYGSDDAAEADAQAVVRAMAALEEGGLTLPRLTIGDVSIFAALVDCLALGEVWSARLRRRFWRHRETGDIAAALSSTQDNATDSEAALGMALARMDRDDARSVIGEVLAIAGADGAGGRGADEIAARFAQKAREAQGEVPGPEIGALIDRYLDIEVEAGEAVVQLKAFAADGGIDLDQPIADLEIRLELIEKQGFSLNAATFSTAAGRRIEYYTGLVFEARARDWEDLGPIAGGGRYDSFLTDLGAPQPLRAVGCSIYADRLAMVLGEHQ
ncbi:MAG: hypothetical protein HKN60_01195, partial [Rhizobiales bacterium]|nr:hypothetical protein [Hyphomicrobiales bacterium]